ncbi:hypothetical protein C8R44DRAFT_211113 [Mycena epipterygia]|nr:hypothetical protein C8R44DRAFT_211113 [Mycena epipterygia]
MSLHSELRITVVDDLDWPTLQECSILTPNSLWPQDVTLDGEDGLSVGVVTPSGISGKFVSPERTPTTSNTFGFPLSPISAASNFTPDDQSPFEKHKRRLRRYHAAESVLARLPVPEPKLSPRQRHADAIRYATFSVASHVTDARLCLRAIRSSGRRDSARWMAEHRLAALESLQAELASSSLEHVDSEADTLRRREANLVRFLGARRGDGLVPIFTRTRGLRNHHHAGETERRCMTVGSPMKLQSETVLVAPTAGIQWPWETRVRSVLLCPAAPKPPVSPLRILTETETASRMSSATPSTPTSGTLSPIEPETPLTELEDEEEEEDDLYEDYPMFKEVDSARSSRSSEDYPMFKKVDSARSHSYSQPPPRLPPLTTTPLPSTLSPDATYAWLTDPSTWANPSSSRWHGDGWEVAPTSASSAASSTASPASGSPTPSPTARVPTSSPTTRTPSPPPPSPARPQTLPPPPAHRFWARNSGSERHLRLPSLRPIAETVRPLPAPPAPPASPAKAKAKVRPLPPVKPLPTPPPPPQKHEKEKGRHFFSGLVRRMHVESHAEQEVEQEGAIEERNKLRKRGSVSSVRSSRSGRSYGPRLGES